MGTFPCSQAGLLAWMLLLLLLLSSSEGQSKCQTPVLPPNSSLRGGGDLANTYPVGTVLRLQCDPGYIPISGIRFMTCLDTHKWSELPTLCQRRRCPIPDIENGNIESGDSLLLGDQITLACNHGYTLIGSSTVRCVLKFGKVDWNRQLPYCKSISCTTPPLIVNGDYDPRYSDEYSVNSAVTYWCYAGYSLIGNSTIACTVAENDKDGMWNSPPPECKKVKCLAPNIPNARFPYGYRETYAYRHSIYIECNPGFTLSGSSIIHCDANSKWNPPVPQCVKN